MNLSHVTPEIQKKLDDLVRETEQKVSDLIGIPSDVAFVVHQIHGEHEGCQGSAVISCMHPEQILIALMYAGMTMSRHVEAMREAMAAAEIHPGNNSVN